MFTDGRREWRSERRLPAHSEPRTTHVAQPYCCARRTDQEERRSCLPRYGEGKMQVTGEGRRYCIVWEGGEAEGEGYDVWRYRAIMHQENATCLGRRNGWGRAGIHSYWQKVGFPPPAGRRPACLPSHPPSKPVLSHQYAAVWAKNKYIHGGAEGTRTNTEGKYPDMFIYCPAAAKTRPATQQGTKWARCTSPPTPLCHQPCRNMPVAACHGLPLRLNHGQRLAQYHPSKRLSCHKCLHATDRLLLLSLILSRGDRERKLRFGRYASG